MKQDQQTLHFMAIKAFGISSFTTVGHLLHINLKEHLLPNKLEIGEAMLRQNKCALAVVNKVNTIDNEYRNFQLEIIAKRPDCNLSDEELMIVEVKENKCRFQFDFSKTYWNSRLSSEHERIIGKFAPAKDIIFDLFAGVGPFSVPGAKLKCKVYANDLNPESYKWLEHNMKRNKVRSDLYEAYNLDAKDFIVSKMKKKLYQEYERVKSEEFVIKPKVHIIMNLPALASKFLINFAGLLREEPGANEYQQTLQLFREVSLDHIIYCYCFLKGAYENPKDEVKRMIELDFGRQFINDELIDIFKVRNVAPYKDMYRVEIRLSEDFLFKPGGIIRKNHSGSLSTNGQTPKKVTIQEPTKRAHSPSNDSLDSESSGPKKRSRIGEYCSIM